MRETSNEFWKADKGAFVHDLYGQLHDNLIFTEQLRIQAMNLYFLALTAIVTVLATVITASGFGQDLQLSLATALAGAALMIGMYLFGLVMFYSYAAFRMRLELDKITARWARHDSNDFEPFYYLGDITRGTIQECKEPAADTANTANTARKIGIGKVTRRVRKVIRSWLRLGLATAKRLIFSDKEVLLLMLANCIALSGFIGLRAIPMLVGIYNQHNITRIRVSGSAP